jgi:ATP-dependent Clp protease ATP-binding subunit ClpB
LAELNKTLANQREQLDTIMARWNEEKGIVDAIQNAKSEIESLRVIADEAKRKGDYAKVAEIEYGKIKEKEAELTKAEQNLKEIAPEKRLTDEEVDANDIADVVARWTGIPVTKMMQSEREKLLKIEEEIAERIIGQKEAVTAVADAIRRSRAGLSDAKKPIGSFLFMGPTGVGKTELVKALAEVMFSDETAIIRLDMSEYMEKHSVSRLVGSPPGYVGYDEGGQLTEAVRNRPYSIILLDEIEKAHGDVFNLLLQVLDDGRLTDSKGRTVDFKNTIIIMTSNRGAEIILENFENAENTEDPIKRAALVQSTKLEVIENLKQFMRPEFLNRIDDQIIFLPLTQKEAGQILALLLKGVNKLLAQQKLAIELTPAAFDQLAEDGYDPQYGARPMKRLLQRDLVNPLSKELLANAYNPGDTIVADTTKEGVIYFTVKK